MLEYHSLQQLILTATVTNVTVTNRLTDLTVTVTLTNLTVTNFHITRLCTMCQYQSGTLNKGRYKLELVFIGSRLNTTFYHDTKYYPYITSPCTLQK